MNPYKDNKGHWTSKENDGGECKHGNGGTGDYEERIRAAYKNGGGRDEAHKIMKEVLGDDYDPMEADDMLADFEMSIGEEEPVDYAKLRQGNKLSSQPAKIPEKGEASNEEMYKNFVDEVIAEKKTKNKEMVTTVNLKLDKPIRKIDESVMEKAYEATEPEYRDYVEPAAELIKKYEDKVDDYAKEILGVTEQMGGVMVGLDFRLKSIPSLARKIKSEIIEKQNDKNNPQPNFGVEDAVKNMRDIARFTSVFDEKDFSKGVDSVIKSLTSKGYKIIKFKNTFVDGAEYKGLNCNFQDENGNVFELQFHTPESMKIKEGFNVDINKKTAALDHNNITSHDYYEKTRVIDSKMKEGTATEQEVKLFGILKERAKNEWGVVKNHPELRPEKYGIK